MTRRSLSQGFESFRLLLSRGEKVVYFLPDVKGTFIRMSESHIGITNGAETSTIVPCVRSICVLPLSLAASHTRCSLPPQIKSSERQSPET